MQSCALLVILVLKLIPSYSSGTILRCFGKHFWLTLSSMKVYYSRILRLKALGLYTLLTLSISAYISPARYLLFSTFFRLYLL